VVAGAFDHEQETADAGAFGGGGQPLGAAFRGADRVDLEPRDAFDRREQRRVSERETGITFDVKPPA
jgi:hypothetical protein